MTGIMFLNVSRLGSTICHGSLRQSRAFGHTSYSTSSNETITSPPPPSVKEIKSGLSSSQQPNSDEVAATPLLEYQRLVKLNRLRNDPHQVKMLESLSALHTSLQLYHPPQVTVPSVESVLLLSKSGQSLWNKIKSLIHLFGNSSTTVKEASSYPDSAFTHIPKGLYLWGDVGCGKTMLMDLFYSTVPKHLTKKRIHFHQFMQNLHKRSHQVILQHGKLDIDPIPVLAAEIAQTATVLCFDEFQVTDVADAMLLRRFLMATLAPSHGLVLFATSNREPNDLYINGIQRELFIPAIRLLERRTEVIYLNSPTDYRKIPKPVSSVYYYPQINAANKDNIDYFSSQVEQEKTHHIKQWFTYFVQLDHEAVDHIKHNDKIKIWGRNLVVPKSIPHTIAQFTFDELCGKPLAAGDYLALASHYKSFIITDIPYLSINVRDKIRRFITFLDAAYNNHCKLATTAANLFNGLFVDPALIKEDNPFNLVEGAADKIQDYSTIKGGSSINNKQKVLKIDNNGEESTEPVVKQSNSARQNMAASKSKRKIHKKLTKELGSSNVDKKLLDQSTQMFSLDEEKFAFVRALSRLTQMSTTDWVKYDR